MRTSSYSTSPPVSQLQTSHFVSSSNVTNERPPHTAPSAPHRDSLFSFTLTQRVPLAAISGQAGTGHVFTSLMATVVVVVFVVLALAPPPSSSTAGGGGDGWKLAVENMRRTPTFRGARECRTLEKKIHFPGKGVMKCLKVLIALEQIGN